MSMHLKINFALRITILTIALMVATLMIFALPAHAAEPKDLAVVSGDTLKAGDIFTGLNADQAEYVLGTPPLPGKDMVLDAHLLIKIAEAVDLNWQPKSVAQKCIVRRAATIVQEQDINAALDKSLREEGIDGKFNIQFADAEGPQIILPPDLPQTVAVKTMRFDPTHDSFEAVLVAPSADRPVKQISLMGKVQRMTDVPVLHTTMRHGEIVNASDIQMTSIPNDEVQNGMVLKADDLAGMTPQRIVEAGKPIRDGDIERPQVLARGDFITLIYKSGPLLLTAKGEAMQNAARGDLVQVINLTSSRSLQGIASGDHEVTISD